MKFLAVNNSNCYSVGVSVFVYYQYPALLQTFLSISFSKKLVPKYGKGGLGTKKVDTKVRRGKVKNGREESGSMVSSKSPPFGLSPPTRYMGFPPHFPLSFPTIPIWMHF